MPNPSPTVKLVSLHRHALPLTKRGIRGRKRLFAFIAFAVIGMGLLLAITIACFESLVVISLPKPWQQWLTNLPVTGQFGLVVDDLLSGAAGGLVVSLFVRGFRIGDKNGYVHELHDLINSVRPDYHMSVWGAIELLQMRDTTVYELGTLMAAIQKHDYENLPYQILFGSTFVKTDTKYARLTFAWDYDDGFYLVETSSNDKAQLIQA